MNGHVGCAYVFGGRPCKVSLPSVSSVFTAELTAIFEALQCARTDGRVHFLLCTDSMSSMQAIDSCFPRNPLVSRIHDLLAGLRDAGIRVTFLWLPSHMGIAGNELADRYATISYFSNTFYIIKLGRRIIRNI